MKHPQAMRSESGINKGIVLVHMKKKEKSMYCSSKVSNLLHTFKLGWLLP